MENLWIGVVVIALSLGGVGAKYVSSLENISFAKEGLEECPNLLTNTSTIWVKDCSALLLSQKKINDK